jgi:hypothetical protein
VARLPDDRENDTVTRLAELPAHAKRETPPAIGDIRKVTARKLWATSRFIESSSTRPALQNPAHVVSAAAPSRVVR